MSKKSAICGMALCIFLMLTFPPVYAEDLEKTTILDRITAKFHDIKNDIAAFQFFNKHCESVATSTDKTKAESRECYARLTKEMRARKNLHEQAIVN